MYEAFYGLSGKPFQLNPDPDFFFASRGHARAYSYLQYGLYQGEGFVVVTGEVGAGKTTLVRSLLKRVDQDKIVAAQIVTTQLDAEDLLKVVAAAFGVPAHSTDKAQLLANLEAFFVSLVLQRKRALLVVDEAQNLTARAVEELRMLSNFQLDNRALLQSFLVGQPELRRVLQGGHLYQLRQRVLALYHLGPMERAETQAYIEHRLKHVGWRGDPGFEPGAFDAIHNASGGIPRRVNLLCNRVMLAGYLGEKHALRAAEVTGVVNEMRKEFGPENVSNPAGGNGPAAPPPIVGLPVAIGQMRAESDLVKLEERIIRLERLLHSTVSLLHTLIERDHQGKSSKKA